MTEILETIQKADDSEKIIQVREFETPEEQSRMAIITAAVLARTIQLDTRRDCSFQQSKTPEYFTD